MNSEKKPLFLLAGPTGVGKTACSVELAAKLNAEIISCDSMQIYKKMDIGTAKIKKNEMQNIVHHMIDIKEPFENYSVSDYVKEASKICEDIFSRGKNVLVVGGTGLYADSLANGSEFSEKANDDNLRNELKEFYEKNGALKLHDILNECDPESAAQIHPNNVKRVIRAIEYFRLTGEKISEHNKKDKEKPSPYNLCYMALTRERSELYERIDKRVDLMIEEGLYDEVKKLYDEGLDLTYTSMQALGYKEFIHYIKGKCTFEESVRILKRDSRRYAKRQLTWFGRNKNIKWINLSEETQNPADICMNFCREFL